jgi:hypothetical protein
VRVLDAPSASLGGREEGASWPRSTGEREAATPPAASRAGLDGPSEGERELKLSIVGDGVRGGARRIREEVIRAGHEHRVHRAGHELLAEVIEDDEILGRAALEALAED